LLSSRAAVCCLGVTVFGCSMPAPTPGPAEPSDLTLAAASAMVEVEDRLVPMWNSEILPLDEPPAFVRQEVRQSIKRFYLERLRADRDAGGGEVDTRFAADIPEDLRQLRYVRSAMIHPRNQRYAGFHTVLANDIAIAGWGPAFPEGSVVVKLIHPAFEDEQGNLFQGELEAMFVFHKDSARFPEAFDGWGFEVVDFYNGTRLVVGEEHARWCHDCHSQSETDVVWSPPVFPNQELAPTEPRPLMYSGYLPPRVGPLP